MFVPFYMVYWYYKHGEKIDKLNAVTGNKTDYTSLCLILGIFIPIVASILMQDNINKLCYVKTAVINTNSEPTSSNITANDEKSITEALKEYKALLDADIITQEEFDTKKKQLLNL